MTTLLAISCVLLAWAVLAFACLGYGKFVFALAASSRARGLTATRGSQMVIGLCVLVMVLQAAHLLLPISAMVAWVILSIGIILSAVSVRSRGQGFRTVTPGIALLLVALWLANRSIGPCDLDDSGMYHYPQIAWMNASPIVPGLGNLSPWYAINCSSFLLVAMANHLPPGGHGQQMINGFLLLLLATESLRGLRALRSGEYAASDITAALLAGPIVLLALSRSISTPSTDLAAGVMICFCVLALLRCCEALCRDERDAARRFAVACLFTAATAGTIKLSTAALGVLLCIICLAMMFMARERFAPQRWAVIAGTLCVATASLWIGRNVILSGHPLYVSDAFALDVDWRVPADRLAILRKSIEDGAKLDTPRFIGLKLASTPVRFWSRLMGPSPETTAGTAWIRPWLLSQPMSGPVELLWPLLLAGVAGVIAIRRRQRQMPLHTWAIASLLIALMVWLIAAPDRRFAWQITWALAGIALSLAAVNPRDVRHTGRVLLAISLLGVLLAMLYQAGMEGVLRRRNPLATIPLIRPQHTPDGFAAMPIIPTQSQRLPSGIVVNVPIDPAVSQVWNASQPAVGYPKPDARLEWRRASNPHKGFRTKLD